MKAGLDVALYDIDTAATARLAAAGGLACSSPRAVATETATVITSLPSAQALRSVLHGPEGLLAGSGGRSLTIVETSTLALHDKEAARAAAAAAGATLLDCPLSGTAGQARTKDLVVYASGEPDAVRRCHPVFAAFARTHHYLGPFGTGTKLKLVTNLLVAVHNVATAEALVLATKAGIDRQTAYDAIVSGAGSSRMFEVRGPMMIAGDYDQPGVAGRIFAKDLAIIGDFARSVDCPTPLFAAAVPVYVAALAHGYGDRDASAVCAVLEQLADVNRGRTTTSS